MIRNFPVPGAHQARTQRQTWRTMRQARLLALFFGALALPNAAWATTTCSVIEGDKDGNGTTDLRIIGTGGKQNVVVEIRDAGYQVQIDCNNKGSFADSGDVVKTGTATIETYSFELGGGGDVITIVQDDDLAQADKDIVLNLGPGTDKATYQSKGHSIVTSSNLAIETVGNGTGNKSFTLDLTGSTVSQSRLIVRTDMGVGVDTVTVLGPATTTGSVVDLGLRLGAGTTNTLVTNDQGGLLSGSSLKVHVEGDDTFTYDAVGDKVSALFSGRVDSHSRVYYSANLNNGNDRWTGAFDLRSFDIDPAGPAGSEVYFDVKGAGGGDVLKVTDNDTLGPATVNGLLSFFLDGGQQGDTLGVQWNGITGVGKLRVWADGGMAWDQATVTVGAGNASRNDIDIYASGGPENDLGSPHGDYVTMAVQNSGAASCGPGGKLILDGGLDGIDTCHFTGNAPHLALNCEAGSW